MVDVGIFLTTAILSGLVIWAARRADPEVGAGGTILFRYGLLPPGLCLLLPFGMPLVFVAIGLARPDKVGVGPGLAVGVAFCLMASPFWWETSRYAMVVSPDGIDCRSPWRGRQFVRWDEVEEVRYSSISSWFVLRPRGHRTFRIPTLVSGLSAFLEECERHLPPEALRRARAGYGEVGRPFPGG
jgi:hypothetical protein